MKEDLVPTRYSILSKRRNGLVHIRLSAHPVMLRGKKSLVRIWIWGFFLKCLLCFAYNMEQLQKALALAKDKSVTVDLSERILVAIIFFSTPAPGVLIPNVVIVPMVVADDTSCVTPEVEQLTTAVDGFCIHEPSLFPCPIKRNRGGSPSTPAEEGSFKQARLLEDDKHPEGICCYRG